MTRPHPILLCTAALIASCDPPQPDDAPLPAPAILVGDEACRLPLASFTLGSSINLFVYRGYPPNSEPINLLVIDAAGRFRWNGVEIGPALLSEYLANSAAVKPVPPMLQIRADREASCELVQRTVATAARAAACTPGRCAFEWMHETSRTDRP